MMRIRYYVFCIAFYRAVVITGMVVCLLVQPSALWAQQESAAKPDRKNAAWYYNKAVGLLRYPDSRETVNRIQEVIKVGWKDKDQELEEILKNNEPAFREFQKALPLKKCDFDFGRKYEYIIQKETPAHSKIRNLCRLLLLKGRHYERGRRLKEAAETYLSALTLAGHVAQDNTVVMKMLALVIEKETYAPFKDCIESGKLRRKDYLKIHDYLADYAVKHFSGAELIMLEEESFLSSMALMVDRYIEDSFPGNGAQGKEAEKAKIVALGEEIKSQSQLFADKYYGNFARAVTSNKDEEWEVASSELNVLIQEAKPKMEDISGVIKAMVADSKAQENGSAVDKQVAHKIVLTLLSFCIPNFKGMAEGYYETLIQLDELKSLALIQATKN